MKPIFLAAAFAALSPAVALAHDGLHVDGAYARSANPVTGAVFMTITNHRNVDCQLVAATSEAAERVELHTHREEDGVMRMVEVEEGFTIPADADYALERGGDHVMLLGLRAPLAEGGAVALTLDFGDCGTLDVAAPVDNRRMPQPGNGAMGGN